MYDFKRGDIIARETGPGQLEFVHLEQIGADGKMSAISDETGKPVGLDTRRDVLRPATMEEVLEARERRERRQGPAGRPGGGV